MHLVTCLCLKAAVYFSFRLDSEEQNGCVTDTRTSFLFCKANYFVKLPSNHMNLKFATWG